MLRSHPKLAQPWCSVWLYRAGASIGKFEWEHYEGRGFPRGTGITVEWQHYVNGEWDRAGPNSFYISRPSARRVGIHALEQPGVALARKQQDWGEMYDWDGKTPVVIEVDTTTPPEIRQVSVVACDPRSSIGESHFWAYDPDMKVIDERGVPK